MVKIVEKFEIKLCRYFYPIAEIEISLGTI